MNTTNINTGYKQELKRTLTTKDLVTYGLVTMLPLAPMQVYGMSANESNGMVSLVFIIGMIAMLFTALSYSKLSREFPVAGSAYSYVQRGINPHVGFVTGWLMIIDYLLVPGLLLGFSAMWMNSMLPSVPIFAWVILFAFINSYVNARGVSLASMTNITILFLELALIVTFLGLGFNYVFLEGKGMGGLSLTPIFQPENVDLSFIAKATSIAVLGFLGFDAISTLSEETKNPTKTVGKAMVLTLGLIATLFVAQSYMAGLIHPNYADLNPDLAYMEIAKEVGGPYLYYGFMIVGVVAVGIANSLAVQSAISRLLFSMSRDKMIPFSNFFKKIHPKYQTPANAIAVVGLFSIIVSLCLPIETIVMFVNFGALTSFMILNLTVIVYFFFKKKQRDISGFIHYFLFPLIGFLVVLFVWSGFDKMTFIVGFSWMFIGIIVGAIKSKGYKVVPEVFRK